VELGRPIEESLLVYCRLVSPDVEMTEETVRSAPLKNDRKTTINQKLTMADTSVLVFLLFLVLPARRPC
jgi:hypothetical protein